MGRENALSGPRERTFFWAEIMQMELACLSRCERSIGCPSSCHLKANSSAESIPASSSYPFCFLPFSACGARQEVSFEQGQALAAEHGKGVRFFETSARSNLNVTEAFEGLATDVILRYLRKRETRGKGCCSEESIAERGA